MNLSNKIATFIEKLRSSNLEFFLTKSVVESMVELLTRTQKVHQYGKGNHDEGTTLERKRKKRSDENKEFYEKKTYVSSPLTTLKFSILTQTPDYLYVN